MGVNESNDLPKKIPGNDLIPRKQGRVSKNQKLHSNPEIGEPKQVRASTDGLAGESVSVEKAKPGALDQHIQTSLFIGFADDLVDDDEASFIGPKVDSQAAKDTIADSRATAASHRDEPISVEIEKPKKTNSDDATISYIQRVAPDIAELLKLLKKSENPTAQDKLVKEIKKHPEFVSLDDRIVKSLIVKKIHELQSKKVDKQKQVKKEKTKTRAKKHVVKKEKVEQSRETRSEVADTKVDKDPWRNDVYSILTQNKDMKFIADKIKLLGPNNTPEQNNDILISIQDSDEFQNASSAEQELITSLLIDKALSMAGSDQDTIQIVRELPGVEILEIKQYVEEMKARIRQDSLNLWAETLELGRELMGVTAGQGARTKVGDLVSLATQNHRQELNQRIQDNKNIAEENQKRVEGASKWAKLIYAAKEEADELKDKAKSKHLPKLIIDRAAEKIKSTASTEEKEAIMQKALEQYKKFNPKVNTEDFRKRLEDRVKNMKTKADAIKFLDPYMPKLMQLLEQKKIKELKKEVVKVYDKFKKVFPDFNKGYLTKLMGEREKFFKAKQAKETKVQESKKVQVKSKSKSQVQLDSKNFKRPDKALNLFAETMILKQIKEKNSDKEIFDIVSKMLHLKASTLVKKQEDINYYIFIQLSLFENKHNMPSRFTKFMRNEPSKAKA